MPTPDFSGTYTVTGTVDFTDTIPGVGDSADITAGTLTLTQSGTSVMGTFNLSTATLTLTGDADLTISNQTQLSGTFTGDPFNVGIIQCGSSSFTVTATGSPSGDPPLITSIMGTATSPNICPGGLVIDGTGASIDNFSAVR